MSKIGKNPIQIPEGVTVTIKDGSVEAKGKNATLTVPVLDGITVKVEGTEILCTPQKETKQIRSNWGTMRALLQNAVTGSTENFTKELVIEGVGYRASMEGKDLVLALGYSHPIKFITPEGITIATEKNTVKISGANKAQVGEVSATIRRFRKPEPYKGKGIRYSTEVVRRKVGKKAGSK